MKQTKTHSIQIRLTENQFKLLQYEATRIGVTISELIRNYITLPNE
jgi:hypothetical protein